MVSRRLPVGAALIVALAAACSTTPEAGGFGTGGDGAGGDGDGAGGTTLAVGGQAGGRTMPDDRETCDVTNVAAERLPVDLYLMLDRSTSMAEAISGEGSAVVTKWQAVTGAIDDFMGQAADDLSLGLQFFPTTGAPGRCGSDAECAGPDGQPWGPCGFPKACNDGSNVRTPCQLPEDCPGSSCEVVSTCSLDGSYLCFPGDGDPDCQPIGAGSCGTPPAECLNATCSTLDYAAPRVAISALPDGRVGLRDAMDGTVPNGQTPTGPALAGALDHARQWATAHPDRRTAVLLATDGEATECAPRDNDGLAALAAAAAAASPPVLTFVVDVLEPDDDGRVAPQLDAIARAGGTSAAVVVRSGAELRTALTAALEGVRLKAVPCELALPEDTAALGYDLVNLVVTPGGGEAVTEPRVDDADACPTAGGWYYPGLDGRAPGAVQPTTLALCPGLCAALSGDAAARAEVALGCPTVIY